MKNKNIKEKCKKNEGKSVQGEAMRLADIDLPKVLLASSYVSFLEEAKCGCDASFPLEQYGECQIVLIKFFSERSPFLAEPLAAQTM